MRYLPFLALLILPCLTACSGGDSAAPSCEPLGGGGFPAGDSNGHPDPFGAKAAGQARAARIADSSSFPQPAHGRQRIEDGDFVLINDRIAAVIEAADLSDGYGRFGGEVLAMDKVGDDGRPLGLSRYGETLHGLGIEMINPTSVTVLNDGSDGQAAVVRVAGRVEVIPFFDGALGKLFPRRYGLEAAQDYVLEPGAEKVVIRLHVVNPNLEAMDFGLESVDPAELYGFFHSSQSSVVTAEHGYAEPTGAVAWVGFDAGPWGFAWRAPRGPLDYGLEVSGFHLFSGPGFAAEACSVMTIDLAEIIAGGPDYDGLREAIRRVTGEPAGKAISGTLADAQGQPVEGAFIHALGTSGGYLSRTRTAPDGGFSIHVPPGQDVTLVPQKRGYPVHSGTTVPTVDTTAMLALSAEGRIHVTATDASNGVPLPVRVQVIPTNPTAETPESFGVPDEINGRLHQEFAVTGDATLTVPPGEHRVIVSRGYEWELLDQTVMVAPGQTAEVPAELVHSVDSTGVLCADFHIHSWFSPDSDDPIELKVKGAITDGLDIPVSSEHEWVAEFQPIIEKLGLTAWAFGVASEELTTFTWGHFGVVPLEPHTHEANAGAIEWIGKAPAEVFDAVRARPENPALIVNHPSGSNFGSYFSAALYDPETGTGRPDLWSDNFDAVEVFNDSDLEANRGDSVAHWFSLLNHGYSMWAVGSSDSHHLRTSPVGYPRTCMTFGHDDPTQLTPAAVRDGILLGNSVISGGLLMTVRGPGGEAPGETVTTAAGTAAFTITVEAPSWIAADSLETIVNGQTVSVEPLLPMGGGPSKRFMNQVAVTLDPGLPRNWVVFHAKGDSDLGPLHPGRHPFAVSNPVFLKSM